jgi:hypothetical protein
MRNTILVLHIITSFLAGILTIVVAARSILGIMKKWTVSSVDVKFPFYITILLYLQLLLGTMLYIFYIVNYSGGGIDVVQRSDSGDRFWAVEHFILMVFTLVISHIGWIFAKNGKTPELIFRKNRLYFGVVFVMILASMLMNIIRHAI